MEFDDGRPQTPGGQRSVHPDHQSAALASRASLQSERSGLGFLDDSFGGFEKLLPLYSRTRAAIGSFKEDCFYLSFEIAKAAAQS